MRDAGQQLTSLVSVSVSQACGFTPLSLQGSISVVDKPPPSALLPFEDGDLSQG